ncbi:hypothetical protein, partial [Pseudomonas syringae group genomosp. 7]|uniref:hypothetical protein n=1 Tax=Pseudomonas syringae group genomosp. 7 TaxID=251699 RepID=UPI00376F6228
WFCALLLLYGGAVGDAVSLIFLVCVGRVGFLLGCYVDCVGLVEGGLLCVCVGCVVGVAF